ncbi:DUF1652 domain-containing protein [Pseudomonas sp. NFIX28]|jgi:hypothetical protein|uniref:DUF1652 domain-containing protein n=1 Tax=Pseudomonas sp. NFIX28 TaxID=1566235 RepID=UPI0008999FB6|nr:DUF1652 domain-containing protein [Pseudomonas sp. NFIX28]SDZ59361.1 Protein of unknown function [Pseudomonas sp. NFIX28]
MISHLELRHIIEAAFLPMKCICHISADNSMTVQLLDADTREELTVTGIDASTLCTAHAIANFVAELKEEARARHASASPMCRQA